MPILWEGALMLFCWRPMTTIWFSLCSKCRRIKSFDLHLYYHPTWQTTENYLKVPIPWSARQRNMFFKTLEYGQLWALPVQWVSGRCMPGRSDWCFCSITTSMLHFCWVTVVLFYFLTNWYIQIRDFVNTNLTNGLKR